MLNELSQKIHANAVAKGFWDKTPNFGELLMLTVSELGEAMDADRKDKRTDKEHLKWVASLKNDSVADEFFLNHIKDTIEDEIADAIMLLLSISASRKIDIQAHVAAKMRYNAGRPKLHGKRY